MRPAQARSARAGQVRYAVHESVFEPSRQDGRASGQPWRQHGPLVGHLKITRSMLRVPTRVAAALLLVFSAAAAAAGTVPLAEAVKKHDLEAVRAMLRQNVDVNASEPD